MKNKGFTLIELLAVIAILAIIALITIPRITGVLKRSKKEALKDNIHAIIKSANTYVAKQLGTDYIEFDFTDPNTKKELGISGSLPSSGKLAINSDGDIAIAAKEGKYCAYKNYDERTITVEECTTLDLSIIKNNIIGAPVYLDPKDLTKTCNESNSVSTTGTKSGCMKFYIFGEGDGKYKMILDHNTSRDVPWNSSGSNSRMNEVSTQLITDTTGWNSSLNPRLITANEVAAITGNTGWDSATATTSQYFYFGSNNTTSYSSQTAEQKARQASYHWLFDYTNGCTSYGCNTADSSTNGYWTSSPVSGNSNSAWKLGYSGSLSSEYVETGHYLGIRPVIEIDKDKVTSEISTKKYKKYTPGETVKFDPVANKKCSSGNTCYTWRVIKVGDMATNREITLQMDHNLVNTDSWSTGTTTSTGPNKSLSDLATATSTWTISKLNYTYNTSASSKNYGTLICTNGTCKITGNDTPIATNVKARMITGEEVRALTMNAGAANGSRAANWSLANDYSKFYYFSNSTKKIGTTDNVASGSTGSTVLSWLLENTSVAPNTGSTANTYGGYNDGYWTLSPYATYSDSADYAYFVSNQGSFDGSRQTNSSSHGIRPVITISKSLID